MDAAAASWLFWPLALWLTFLPKKIFFSKPHRFFLPAATTLFSMGYLFLLVMEYYFFEEFNSRFNAVAVDYLIYPHEVFVNIWDGYPVVPFLAGCLLAAALIYWAGRRYLAKTWQFHLPLKSRALFLAAWGIFWLAGTRSASFSSTRWSHNRVLNEVSGNSLYSLVYAAYTHHLDFGAFYRTIPKNEAYGRTRKILGVQKAIFDAQADSIERLIPGRSKPKPANLVLILVESFGSEFWGAFGRNPSLTPYMDELAKQGLLFTNLYACGNRTVRGLEGTLSSFPPLPGDSIVKRHLSDHVSTLARTLKTANYRTLFLYGGRGMFDGMRSYALKNGFERFIEQKDFSDPGFTTIWGVSDEDLFRRSIEEFREFNRQGRSFFGAVLTVSNHKPYTYPTGRIAEDPQERRRENAVKYTDWALGEFFRLARQEPFFNNTVFAVVADHGARVYGSQTIPIHSYEIPLVILSPGIKQAKTIDTLGGSLDVGPTLLGLLGLKYRSVFFGRDLLAIPKKDGQAVLHHNRDIGLFRRGRMVVLGLNKTVEFFQMDTAARALSPSPRQDPGDTELERDAIAIYQTADDLYTHRQFRLRD